MVRLFAAIISGVFSMGIVWGQGKTSGVLDGKDFSRTKGAVTLVGEKGHEMVKEGKGASLWRFEDGVLTASKLWDSVVTKEKYGDFRLHVEFNVNQTKGGGPEKRGNSGVYIQKRYEIQILDSHGIKEEDYKASYAGSLYKLKKPDKLVSKRAGEWQSYDIVFRAARFEGGEKKENARITVYHNGILIHDDYEIPRKTGAGAKEGPEPGVIKLQGHNNPVKFRNVWIERLDLSGSE